VARLVVGVDRDLRSVAAAFLAAPILMSGFALLSSTSRGGACAGGGGGGAGSGGGSGAGFGVGTFEDPPIHIVSSPFD
jgi:hypothetical protein